MVDAAGAIYVLGGGYDGSGSVYNYFNDVWASTDGGARPESVGGGRGVLGGYSGVLGVYSGVLGGYSGVPWGTKGSIEVLRSTRIVNQGYCIQYPRGLRGHEGVLGWYKGLRRGA